MVFVPGVYVLIYGINIHYPQINTYCVNNTSASDYGKCYNTLNKAIFVQTDTTTWPIDPTTGDSFPCAKDGTCIRYTNTIAIRNLETIFSYSGKQAIMQSFSIRVHTVDVAFYSNMNHLGFIPVPGTNTRDAEFSTFLPAYKYNVLSWPIYDPVNNFEAYLDPYTITFGRVNTVRWNGSYFTSTLYVLVNEAARNNIWYAFSGIVKWAYESSPLAVIPLDYDRDYVPYQELRNAFGFSINGVDQPGWNADDIIRVLRELFPNRAWAVFDDRQYVLYLYNLSPDYVPDWLIEKLSPTAMKVLQSPADVAVAKAWLDLLNERNAQIPPQAELP